jgi:hypothetical protein
MFDLPSFHVTDELHGSVKGLLQFVITQIIKTVSHFVEIKRSTLSLIVATEPVLSQPNVSS